MIKRLINSCMLLLMLTFVLCSCETVNNNETVSNYGNAAEGFDNMTTENQNPAYTVSPSQTDNGCNSIFDSLFTITNENKIKLKDCEDAVLVYENTDVDFDSLIDYDELLGDERRLMFISEYYSYVLPEIVNELEDNEFRYVIHKNGKAQVTAYKGSLPDIVIPNEVSGYPVSYIGKELFKENSSLRSVDIGDNTVIIGEAAFSCCHNLKKVILPETLKIIACAFDDCTNLTDLTLPDSLEIIGNDAFYGCGLTAINIPSMVNEIGSHAFYECKALKNLTIENGVNNVNLQAFAFTAIEKLYIPAGLTDFHDSSIFCNCENLKSVEYASHMDKDTEISITMFKYCKQLSRVILPDNIVRINGGAFIGCHSLKEIRIPASVKKIDEDAFLNCRSLKNVYFESADCDIDAGAFYGCFFLNVHAPAGGSVEKYCEEKLNLRFVPT